MSTTQELLAAKERYDALVKRIKALAAEADSRPMGTAYHTEILDLLRDPS